MDAKGALALAQSYDAAKAKRLAADKKAAALKEVETKLRQELMDTLRALEVKSVGDKRHVYALVSKLEPTVTDWEGFYAHIKRTGAFELLYRRVNPAAVRERWEVGKKVPGVDSFPVETLSVTKAKGA